MFQIEGLDIWQEIVHSMTQTSCYTSTNSSSVPNPEQSSNETGISNVVINNFSIKKANMKVLMKNVFINNSMLTALIDTKSDLNILSWDEFQTIETRKYEF